MQVSICIQLLIKATCHTICFLVAIYHHTCTQINADMLSNDVTHTSMTMDCSKVFTCTTEESSRHHLHHTLMHHSQHKLQVAFNTQ